MKSVAAILALCCVGLSMAVPCSKMHAQGVAFQRKGLIGGMIYQCDKDGSYRAMQCHASTGYCFCVDKNGTTIKNATRLLRGCDCVRDAYTATQKHLLGMYVPQCEADGTYSTRQCHASTGYCWCTTPQGELMSNATFLLKSCECISKKFAADKSGLLGAFRPRCDTDGSYSKMQFLEAYAWCVRSDGTQITNKTRGLKSCDCPVHRDLVVSRGLLGSYRPECDADGYYSPMQCHERQCWCTRTDGSRLEVEAKSPAVCKCYRQHEEAIKAGFVGILPECV